eukprot:9460889-Pyramimonas_sp.AAC.1
MTGGMCAARGGARNQKRRHEIWGDIMAPDMISTLPWSSPPSFLPPILPPPGSCVASRAVWPGRARRGAQAARRLDARAARRTHRISTGQFLIHGIF